MARMVMRNPAFEQGTSFLDPKIADRYGYNYTFPDGSEFPTQWLPGGPGIGYNPGGPGGTPGPGMGGGGGKPPTPMPGEVPGAGAGAGAGAGSGSGAGSAFANWAKSLTPAQWAKLGLAGYGFFQGNDSGQGYGAGPGGTVTIPNYLTGLGAGMASTAGYGNLLEILMSQGRTDPQAMNRLIASTQQGTQNQMGQFQGEMARRGLQNSGVGMAMEQAIGAAGQDRVAGIRAEEARLAEERKRQDLDLLLRLIVQPQQDWTALQTGQYNANRAASNQESAADKAYWASLIKTVADLYTNYKDEEENKK